MKTPTLLALGIALLAANTGFADNVSLRMATFDGCLFGSTMAGKDRHIDDPADAAIVAKLYGGLYEPVALIVIITNNSEVDIDLYETGNRWGYFSLSFVVELPDGTTKDIRKVPLVSSVDFPDFITLKPSRSHAVAVMLSDGRWRGVDVLTKYPAAKIRAVFHQQAKMEDVFRKEDRYKDAQIFHEKITSPAIPVVEILDPNVIRRLKAKK